MNRLQILASEYRDEDGPAFWRNRGIDIIPLTNWRDAAPDVPLLCSSDLLHENVRIWLTENRIPTIYSARGYLGNHIHKKRLWWRASLNGWANTILRPVPYSRWDLLNLPRHPWKVKQIKNVLIAPSKMTAPIWDPVAGYGWAESIAEKFPGANIRIRRKVGKSGVRYSTLWDDFDWADLVVSQSSAITAEAFWYGKKVISTEPCVTWAASPGFNGSTDNWQDPTVPLLREEWHEHLAWSQYTIHEWVSGEAFDLMERYLGDITQYQKDTHIYKLVH